MKSPSHASPQTRAGRSRRSSGGLGRNVRNIAATATFLSVVAAAPGASARSHGGAAAGPIVARPSLPVRACDAIEPVCVHAAADVPPDVLARARASAARAYAIVVDTVGLPPPLFDDARGGDPRLDVYLAAFDPSASSDDATDDDAPPLVRARRELLDPMLDRDAAPAFVQLAPSLAIEGGCALDVAMARGIAEASWFGLDVSETRVVVDGMATYLGELAAECPTARSAERIVDESPWRSTIASPARVAAFARWLDGELTGGSGAIVPLVASMAVQHRGLADVDDVFGPAQFDNDPTVFDVIASTMQARGGSLDDAFLAAAVARWRFDDPPPAAEWTLPLSTLPRRVAVSHAVEPTGATFVRIDVDRAVKGGGVEIDLRWETGARFRWRVLKLDDRRHIVGETGVAALERMHETSVDVRSLDGVRSILVVGVNEGVPGVPWTPDTPATMGHGYEIGVYDAE